MKAGDGSPTYIYLEKAVKDKRNSRYSLKHITLAFAAAISVMAPALSQQSPSTAQENWHPKDGVYAGVGKSFSSQCDETGNLVVELNEESIAGNEWNCKVNKTIYSAPSSITLNMTCDDYNLAEDLKDPNPEDRRFKETMTLQKINDRSMLVRKTQNGKFTAPTWKAAYCPASVQQTYLEAKARDKAEAARKALQEPKKEK